MRNWPQLAKASETELKAASMYIGGCSFQRHWENVEKATNLTFKPYDIWISDAEGVKRFKSNIPQMLAADKWDFVTIQQASHAAWDPDRAFAGLGEEWRFMTITPYKVFPTCGMMSGGQMGGFGGKRP